MTAVFRASLAGIALAVSIAVPVAAAADDTGLERLTTCTDSWRDWQATNNPQLATYAAHMRTILIHKQNDPFGTPKIPTTIAGFRVLQIYPESVGMGVGFSVLLAAPFDKAKKAFEAKLGKTLEHCENGEGMHDCEHQFAPERTFMVTADDTANTQSLVGCYYLYEK